jgi:hypothetical protein
MVVALLLGVSTGVVMMLLIQLMFQDLKKNQFRSPA